MSDGCERCQELEQRVEILEETVQELENALTGERGSWLAEQQSDDSGCIMERLEAVEAGEGGVSVDTASRKAMVDIHVTLQDRTHGRDIDTKRRERGAVLFRQFIRKLDPDYDLTGVEYSNGRYKLFSKRAEEILASENLMISNASVAIGRAMAAVENHTEWKGESLFRHESQNGHSLSVHGETWEQYLTEVSTAAGHGVAGMATDDPGNSGEDAVDTDAIDEELDRLTGQSANTVVSGSEGSVLVADGEGDRDD